MHAPNTNLKRVIATSSLLLMFVLSVTARAVKAPDFNLPGSMGTTPLKNEISLKSYKNKTVYVDFWASWCTPCKQSFPWMNDMQKRYGKQGLTIIAINLDENRSKVDNFLKKVPAEFMIAYDPAGATAERYNLKVMPTSYLIDKMGKLVAVHKGFKSQDKQAIENKIKDLMQIK